MYWSFRITCQNVELSKDDKSFQRIIFVKHHLQEEINLYLYLIQHQKFSDTNDVGGLDQRLLGLFFKMFFK